MEDEFILLGLILIALIIACSITILLNPQYVYIVEGTTCTQLTSYKEGGITFSECEDGINYINPSTYKRLSKPSIMKQFLINRGV